MLRIEIVDGKDKRTLMDSANAFLAGLDTDSVKGIKYDIKELTAIIEYEVKESWDGFLCADCKHWDDSGISDAVIGLCQACGGRKRFNCKACDKFSDVRR